MLNFCTQTLPQLRRTPTPPCCAPAEACSLGAAPTTREAQAVADEIFASFVSQEVDKVELVYTKFVSLINSNPTIQVSRCGFGSKGSGH